MNPCEKRTCDDLPPLDVLVDAADAALHPWTREHVSKGVRQSALSEELGFWLHTAARDMAYAEAYAKDAPQSGQPPREYLDKWVAVGADGHVLAGPRYLGLDPDLPFVGVSASDRPLVPNDRDRLAALAREGFAAFSPGFVMVTTGDPVGAWPDTRSERRQVVGLLRDLRRRETPPELSAVPRTDTAFYDRYLQIHSRQVAHDPTHARHARCEDQQDLADLAGQGLLFDVQVNDEWAGIIAAEADVRRGIRGATVVELLLDPEYRGLRYGQHLSTLLAKVLPQTDEECLMGTIHVENVAAYRSALRAGRVDVGGEIVIPL